MKIKELLDEAIDVDRTYQKYGQQIAQRLKSIGKPSTQSDVEEFIFKWKDDHLDLNNTYAIWLLTHWLNQNIQQLEDVERAKSYLKTFDQNKLKMDQDKRDINRYVPFVGNRPKPNQLILQTHMEQFIRDNPPDQERLARDIEQAKKEIKVIYQGSQVTIIQPLTQLAASVWGRDTDWCTAYGYEFGKHPTLTNQFNYYNQQGPMFIISFGDGAKYQLHNYTQQFMDVNDQQVYSVGDKKWNSLKFLPKDEVRKLAEWNLAIVPEELRTPEICLAAVKQDGSALYYVPEKFKTPEIYRAAVNQNGLALKYVPEQFKTPEIYLAAVKQNGLALAYVPEELRTPEIYLAAVNQNGFALTYVTKELRTPEIYLDAVKHTGLALAHVPEQLRTPEMCLAAVKQNGLSLVHVPEQFKTLEICLAAVKQTGDALKQVPEESRTLEICLAAVKQSGVALVHVPEQFKTPEMCLAAVKRSGLALSYVPKQFKTPEMCLAAVKQTGYALEHVPEQLRTPEMCLTAVKQTGYALIYVPEQFKTLEICLAAVKQNGNALKYVPEQLRNKIKAEAGYPPHP
jgi:hypothetical protein